MFRTRQRLAKTVEAQAEAIAHLEERVEALSDDRGPDAPTRRGLLAAAGGAAVGALAARPGTAAAADGDPLLVGSGANAASAPTKLSVTSGGDTFWVSQSGTSVATVIAATAPGECIGLYGRVAGFPGFPTPKAGAVGVSGSVTGVAGQSTLAPGVSGESSSSDGVAGITKSENDSGVAVRGTVSSATSATHGVLGTTPGSGAGVRGNNAGSGPGVHGHVSGAGSTAPAVLGSTAGSGPAVRGDVAAGSTANAVHARTAGSAAALLVEATGPTPGAPAMTVTQASTQPAIVATAIKGRGAQLSGKLAPLRLVPAATAGPPTTGAHLRGDLIVDSAGDLYLCTANGTPGTWKRVQLV